MKHSIFGVAALCLAVVTFSSDADAANTLLTNPFGLGYATTTGSSAYGRPGGLIITGRCNRYDSGFMTARANGAEVLAYLNPVEVEIDPVCSLDTGFYNGNVLTTPRWPYPSSGARANFPNNKLTDIRKGSVWSNTVVAYISNLMREDRVDGVFLDVVGARLWTSMANWDSWPQWEKDAWTEGNVDLAKRLDAARRAINPRFIIINNNLWTRGGAELGLPAERYVDGVAFEHHAATSTYHRNYAGRTFGNLGHRRVLAIGRSTADSVAWEDVQGITHVSNQWTYGQVTAPPVAFHRLTDRPRRFGRSSSGTLKSSGMAANYKRGSKFTVSYKGRILNFGAYLDGGGGPSGSQSLRVAMYTNSNGQPGSLVTQSSAVSVASGSGSRWVYFPANVAFQPGTYWLMIHSGSSNAVSRTHGDGSANWYGNGDAYSDGAANPAGSGSLGTQTISVFANYTVGH